MIQICIISVAIPSASQYYKRSSLFAVMLGTFMQMMNGDNAPDPQAVADSILTLVQAPAGSRPLRTIVDPMMNGGGADVINQVSSEVQSQLLNNLGIGHVLPA